MTVVTVVTEASITTMNLLAHLISFSFCHHLHPTSTIMPRWTEQEDDRIKEAYELNEKGKFVDGKVLSQSALAKKLNEEELLSQKSVQSLKKRLLRFGQKSQPKVPRPYKEKDSTGRYGGHWNTTYKLAAIHILALSHGSTLTLLKIKNGILANCVPKGSDFVFDDVAFIDAMNTGIYLNQIEMIRSSAGDEPRFKLKETFVMERDEKLRSLGRANECIGEGK